MYRIFKLLSRISAGIFVGMLLYVYAFLPDSVGLYFDENGKVMFETDREVFFYGSMGIFTVVTIILSFFKKSLKAIPVTNKSNSISESKKSNLQIWADGLSLILNIFFVFSVTFVGLYHNDEHFNIAYFAFIVYVGPILTIGWFFYLIYIFLSKS